MMLDQFIAEDPDILGGVPCFTGTRVPVEHVLASLDKGVSLERLQASWPFLSEAHLEAARQYLTPLKRAGAWLAENREALESSNAFVEAHGLPLDHIRVRPR